MSEIIINVIIILGIIVAGGFLIFFVGDLLLSIIDPQSDEKKIKAKRKKVVEDFNKKLANMTEFERNEIKKDPNVQAIMGDIQEGPKEEPKAPIIEVYSFDKNVADEKPVEEKKVENTAEEKDNEINEEQRRINEKREALERRKAEILRRMQELQDDDDDEDEEEDEEEGSSEESESVNEESEEVEEKTEEDAESEEEIVEEEIVEEESEEENEDEEEVEEPKINIIDDEEDEKEDINEAIKEMEAEKLKYQNLIKELMAKNNIGASVGKPVGSKESYEEKLTEKENALAENEKELRACKKEYMPLFKVQKTLEKDEKRLRIKEAQVAKQKIILYGVNNVNEIDPEKAQKLSEELDLLDGLKLSVEHCREVIAKNKDRLPILEKMYNVLTKQNEELKNDVEELKATLKKFN